MTFTEIRRGGLVYTAVPGLDVPHAFTTRLGGVDAGAHPGLHLAVRRGEDPAPVLENHRILCAALGLDAARLICRRQIHSTKIDAVTLADVEDPLAVSPEADGLMTDVPGLPLLIFTADCVPILLHDPVRGAVAALHAGWRGTLAGMAEAGVRAMAAQYGSDPGDILAAVGPAIGPCCFEAGPEVREAAVALLGGDGAPWIARTPFGPDARPDYAPREGKYFLDLKEINRTLLLRAGVRAEHIAVSRECTRCRPDRYWSYRYHGAAAGRQGAVIALPPA